MSEIKEIYQNVARSYCLRMVHEVLEADQGQHVQVVAFNGFVRTRLIQLQVKTLSLARFRYGSQESDSWS